jgi:hypothetical protein
MLMIAVALLAIVPTGATHAKSQTCSDERKQCYQRCEYVYKFKGAELNKCFKRGCDGMFEQCKATGFWYITRTKTAIGPLEKK